MADILLAELKVKGDSFRNPRIVGDNLVMDGVVTNIATNVETVTAVTVGSVRGPAVVPGVQSVAVSGATTIPVLLDKMYMLSGAGTVTLTGEVGVFATLVLAAGMRVSGFSLSAGMFVAINHPDIGWRFYPTPEPIAGDTTAPSAGALAATLMDTVGLLRVTNATDDTAMHELPYRFSTDGGTTWSPWQASASYVLTGLTAGSAYSFRHQTRDASSNLASGAVTAATTAAAGTWTTRMFDAFDAADGTAIAGRTPDTGTAWGAAPIGAGTIIRGSKASGTGLNNTQTSALWPNGSALNQRVRVTFDYALPISPPYGAVISAYQGINAANTNWFDITLTQSNAGVKSASIAMYGGGSTWSAAQLTTTIPESGTLTFDYFPTRRVGVVKIGATIIGFFSGGVDLPWYGLIPRAQNNATMDNLRVEVSST